MSELAQLNPKIIKTQRRSAKTLKSTEIVIEMIDNVKKLISSRIKVPTEPSEHVYQEQINILELIHTKCLDLWKPFVYRLASLRSRPITWRLVGVMREAQFL